MMSTILLLLVFCNSVSWTYGTSPRTYHEGDEVKLEIGALSSSRTLLPLDYYDLPFCRPKNGIQKETGNLGQQLAGQVIQNTPHKIRMKTDMFCEQLCVADIGNEEQDSDKPTEIVDAIHDRYHTNYILDDLHAATKTEDGTTFGSTEYGLGSPLGFIADRDNKAYIFNHVNFEVMYHPVEGETNQYRVVYFVVVPFSIAHNISESAGGTVTESDMGGNSSSGTEATINNPIPSCDKSIPETTRSHTNFYDFVNNDARREPAKPQPASGQVLFTYDVIWIENTDLPWSARWDVYLTMDYAIPAKVHWLSIVNSCVVLVVVASLVVLIGMRMMKDIANYRRAAAEVAKGEQVDMTLNFDSSDNGCCLNVCICLVFGGCVTLMLCCWQRLVLGNKQSPSTVEDLKGWKAVQGDVFRPPSFSPLLLSVAFGTGGQVFCTTAASILLAAGGLANPIRPGYLVIGILLSFVCTGIVGGYTTGRMYKALSSSEGKKNWWLAALLQALGFPGLCFGTAFVVESVCNLKRTTLSVDPITVWILIGGWLGIMVPLVLVGARAGYHKAPIRFPMKPSPGSKPREIPGPTWAHILIILPLTILGSGILPFGCSYVELYFGLAALFEGQYYYVFGFLFLVFVIMSLTCAVVAVFFTYVQLRLEDYRWWWRSFVHAGSVGIFVFIYSMIYFRSLEATHSEAKIIFFGFMGVVSFAWFLMMGFVGLLASLWFTKTVFAVTGGEDGEEASSEPLMFDDEENNKSIELSTGISV